MSADPERRDPGRNVHFIFDGYHLQRVFFECFGRSLGPANVRDVVKKVTADSKDEYRCKSRPRRFNDIKCNFVTGRLPDELPNDAKEHELTKAIQLKQLLSRERRFEQKGRQYEVYFLQHELEWVDDADSQYEIKKHWKQVDSRSDEVIVTLLNNVPRGDLVFLSSLDGVEREDPRDMSIAKAAEETARESTLVLLSFGVLARDINQRVNERLRKVAFAHQNFKWNPQDERAFENVRITDNMTVASVTAALFP